MNEPRYAALELAREMLGGHVGIARALGYADVRNVLPWTRHGGTRLLPPHHCVTLERVTDGRVSRKDLRPDWRDIWPELE